MKAFFKNPKISGGFSFNPEARQRAKDHLLSVGYRPEQLKPIEWPEDAVYATRSPRGDWEFTYKSDILAERRKRMQRCLYWKREHDAVYTVPAYVWVFHIPGSNFYPGWWTYLIGKNIAEKANSYIDQIMEFFPVLRVSFWLFNDDMVDKIWMEEFAKVYSCGRCGGKPEGKAPVWVNVQNGSIIEILGRGKWHSGKVVA